MTKPLHEMTTHELCEWHADRVYRRVEKSDTIAYRHWVDRNTGEVETDSEGLINCPFEPTLDDAARAMPDGWWWERVSSVSTGYRWIAGRDEIYQVMAIVEDTGDETRDRYLLAALAREAEGGRDEQR